MEVQHSHYDNLFVTPNAPIEVIKASFKVLAQKYHPDRNSSSDAERVMKIINQAWDVLGDESRRKEYDRAIGRSATRRAAPASPENNKQSESKPKSNADTASKPTRTFRTQAQLIAELEGEAVRLWFNGYSQESLRAFLRAQGLHEAGAETLVQKVVNWS
ncbi:J domain-containing protein [Leptothrix sp. BB-4]